MIRSLRSIPRERGAAGSRGRFLGALSVPIHRLKADSGNGRRTSGGRCSRRRIQLESASPSCVVNQLASHDGEERAGNRTPRLPSPVRWTACVDQGGDHRMVALAELALDGFVEQRLHQICAPRRRCPPPPQAQAHSRGPSSRRSRGTHPLGSAPRESPSCRGCGGRSCRPNFGSLPPERSRARHPWRRAIASPSAIARTFWKRIMLFRILTACPLPTGPQWVTSLAMCASTGRRRSTRAASPPTMMLSVPSMAACRVRATGASLKSMPRRPRHCRVHGRAPVAPCWRRPRSARHSSARSGRRPPGTPTALRGRKGGTGTRDRRCRRVR